ncbi:MAG: sigma-54-dependent Fis family transcriptional regulator, partial [candidate division KSB1 bacterium]|nr:sigma-54-dependent Fis family transcriptional regulator [candidate division KSB1 bacterium]
LANHFIATFNREYGRQIKGLSQEAQRRLLRYPWPGNVRELKNTIERAVLLENSDVLSADHLNLGAGHIVKNFPLQLNLQQPKLEIDLPPQGISLVELEKAVIQKALQLAKGNQCQAARLLRISRETLRYRLRKFGIK